MIELITTIIKAVVEGFRAAFFVNVGETRERLKGMENVENLRDIADRARTADSVPEELDPDNRRNR